MSCRKCDQQKSMYRKGLWSPEEDQKLRDYVLKYGHACWSAIPAKAGLERNGKSCRLRWSQIATFLPGRTDNEIKNNWNTYMKKKENKLTDESDCIGNETPALPPIFTKNSICQSSNECNSFGATADIPHQTQVGDVHTFGEECKSTLPKLLFAEWLSNDHLTNERSTPEFIANLNSEDPSQKENHAEDGLSYGEFADSESFPSQIIKPIPYGKLNNNMYIDNSFNEEFWNSFTMM